jgi:hypothetical protein
MGAITKMTIVNPSRADLEVDKREMGRADTLRFNVSTFVVDEKYDRAIQELRDFIGGESEYPNFKSKIERYISHSIDLIHAIRAKRNFPGKNSLTIAKQQELKAKFHEHFNELQFVLKQVEKIYLETKLTDIRSTVLVVRALVNAIFAITLVGLFLEAYNGMAENIGTLSSVYLQNLIDWVFNLLKL